MKVGTRVQHKILLGKGTITEIVDRFTVKVRYDGYEIAHPVAIRVLQELREGE